MCLKFEETDDGMEMQFKPRDLFLLASQAVWNGTGSQLTLQAFMAVFWHLTACLDGPRLQHRARQGNE